MNDKTSTVQQQGEILHENEERFRMLYENAPLGYHSLDQDGRLIVMNRAWLDMLGYTREEAVGQWFGDFLSPQSASRFQQTFPRFKATGETQAELDIVRKDGTNLTVLVHGRASYDEQGNFGQTHCILQDITERKRAEEALRQSEARFRSLVEQTTDAVFCYEYDPPIPTDLPIKEQVRLFYKGVLAECNDMAARSYGAARAAEVVGKELTELFGTAPGSLDDFFRTFIQNDYRTIDAEGVEILPDGSKRYYLNNGYGVLEEGKLLRVWGTFRDITEQKLAEEALRAEKDFSQGILDALVDTVFVFDSQTGKALRWNRTFCEISGYTDEEIALRKAPDDWYNDQDLEKAAAELEKLSRGEKSVVEMTLITKDGRRVPTEYSAAMVQDPKSDSRYIIAVGRDISERIRAGEALHIQRDLGIALSSIGDLTEALNLVLEAALRTEKIDSGGVYLSDAPTGELDLTVHTGMSAEFIESVSHYDADAPNTQLVLAGKSVYMHSADFPPSMREPLQREGLRALAVIPVMYEGHAIAALNLASHVHDEIPVSTRHALEAIAAQIGGVITRLEAVQALQASEERYRVVSELTSDVAYVVSVEPDGTTVAEWVTGALTRITGFTLDELVARGGWPSLMHPADMPLALQHLQVHLTGQPDVAEYRIITKNGKERWLRDYGYPVWDEVEGRVVRIIGAAQDIAEQKLAEEALREREERFRALVQNSSDIIIILEADGTVRYVSPPVERILGYSPDDFSGLDPFEYVHPDDEPAARQRLAEAMQRPGVPMSAEFRLRHANGSWVQVETITNNLLENPSIRGVVVNARDITERKWVEEALRHSLVETTRSQRLLLALSQAAQAVQRARTPEEVYQAIGEQISELGYQVAVLTLTDDGTHLSIAHLTFDSTVLRAAERLSGLSAQGYRFRLAPGGFYERIVVAGETGLSDSAADHITEALPGPARPLAGRLAAALGLGQAIYAPLKIGDQVQGMLTVIGDDLTKAAVPAVTAFANQAAIALENARLYEQIQARSRYLETLQRINATLRSTLPLDHVLETIVRNTGKTLGYTGVLIVLPDDAGERLILGAVWGGRFLDAAIRFTGLEVGVFSLPLTAIQNPMATAYLNNEFQFWSGNPERIVPGIEPAISPKLTPAISQAMGARGAACVPLPAAGGVVGVLIAFTPREHLPAEERTLLLGLADQAGLAIHNAQLYQAAQQEIAERKRAEEALRQREQEFKTLVENNPDMVVRFDQECRHVYVNPAVEKELGTPPETLLGKTHHELGIPVEQADWSEGIIRQIFESGQEMVFETTIATEEGNRYYLTRGVPELAEDGSVASALFIHRNITERKKAQERIERLNRLNEDLLSPCSFDEKLKLITDGVVAIFDADFARIWITQLGDLCESGCIHAQVTEGPHVCRHRDYCLHLLASSGRYTHIDGEMHRRVPFGCYKIGRVAAGEDAKFITNDAVHDPRVHDHEWARELGLVSFAGYRLISTAGEIIGVLALFSKHAISHNEDALLEGLANTTTQVIQTTRAEDALRESEANLRQAQRIAHLGSWELDLEKNDFAVSEEMLHIFKFKDRYTGAVSIEEFASYIHPDDRETVLSALNDAIAGTAPYDLEFRILRTDGQVRSLHAQGEIIVDESGRPIRMIGTGLDITEREQLLAQVQEQAQRVQHIVDTVPEGVILLDPDLRVLLANPLGKKDLAALADAKIGDVLTRLGDRAIEELLTSPPQGLWHEVGAEHRSFQAIARPIEDGPTPKGWVLVVRDVTQQREVERRVQQQERLATVGQLAAGMAHDFNNIMAVVTLYAGISLRAPDLPDSVRERLQTINEQAHRASRLIQQILDFSRRAVLERGPLDLIAFLKEQIKMLQRTLPEHIQIDLTYGKDDYIIHADPTRIQQAVMNLATNARDAMPEGGWLHFGLERVSFSEHDTPPLPEMAAAGPAIGEWIRMTVTDTGSGIPPKIQPHVFDPFFTTKEPGKGTGLGLAQVYGIVKQHEGHIDFETEPDRGTTFILYLPALAVQPPQAPAAESESLTQGQKQTILVVEDDAATRQALVESLKMLNYQVLAAVNGRQALAIFEQHASTIDLVLSDVVMPQMGGRALLRALQERDQGVRVVLLTGHPLEEQEFKDLHTLGLRGWILKPLSVEQLAQVVAEALENPCEG